MENVGVSGGQRGGDRMSDGENLVTEKRRVLKPLLPQRRGRGLPDGIVYRGDSNSWTDGTVQNVLCETSLLPAHLDPLPERLRSFDRSKNHVKAEKTSS